MFQIDVIQQGERQSFFLAGFSSLFPFLSFKCRNCCQLQEEHWSSQDTIAVKSTRPVLFLSSLSFFFLFLFFFSTVQQGGGCLYSRYARSDSLITRWPSKKEKRKILFLSSFVRFFPQIPFILSLRAISPSLVVSWVIHPVSSQSAESGTKCIVVVVVAVVGRRRWIILMRYILYGLEYME